MSAQWPDILAANAQRAAARGNDGKGDWWVHAGAFDLSKSEVDEWGINAAEGDGGDR